MLVESFQVANDLYLVTQTLSTEPPPAQPVVIPTHHVIVVDCSGSMYTALQQLRQQLKNKLATLVNDGDLVTIVWFSGHGQYGVLFEGLPIKSLRDLTDMHRAIDRFLQPMGLTGFKGPLDEVLKVVTRGTGNHATSLFFMTDGYDNQSTKADILASVTALAPVVSGATFVEYGYYANRQLLAEMAERVGGSLVHCEDFRTYEPTFEAAMGRRLVGAKKITVRLEGQPLHGVAFSVIGTDVVTFAPNDQGAILVPEGTTAVHYLCAKATAQPGRTTALLIHSKTYETSVSRKMVEKSGTAVHAALYLMSQRMKSNEVFALLAATGDVRLIKLATNAIGKQKLSEFQNALLATVANDALRLTEGYDPTLVPAEDAYTVLDLLADLMADDSARFFPNHPQFVYQRTGRKAVAKTALTEEQRTDIALFEERQARAKTEKEIDALQVLIDTIAEGGKAPLKFVQADDDGGVPISNLTFNEDRPNVSVLVRLAGTVDLTALAQEHGVIAEKVADYTAFPSFIYRNYTLIKDGVVNVDALPVTMSSETAAKLQTAGVEMSESMRYVSGQPGALGGDILYVINLRSIPTVNRKMVKEVSAKRLFELDYARKRNAAAQKVFKAVAERHFGKRTSDGWKVAYGDEAVSILQEAGLTDYSGFSPKKTLAEAQDVYQAVELKVSIKGLSSLPAVDAVEKAIDAKKKLTISQRLMAEFVQEYRGFIASDIYTKFPAAKQEDLLRTWLETKKVEAIVETRRLIRELAQIKFAVVLGQVWFSEFSSLEENTLTVKLDGEDVLCTVDLKDIEVKI